MPRYRVLLVVRAVTWCGVVAHDATPSRGYSRWKATCLPCTSVPLPHYDALHSDRTKHRSLRVISHPFCGLQQENNLLHHGWRSHVYVDPDTETKCDSCCASSEHLILCAEVITQVEGRRNSQRYTVLRCEVPAVMVRTSTVKRAVQQNKSFDFSKNWGARKGRPPSVVHVATTLHCKELLTRSRSAQTNSKTDICRHALSKSQTKPTI